MTPTYSYYRDILRGQRMPCAFVDVDLLDENIAAIKARAGSKTIRVASKSVRVPWALRRILDADPVYQGIMAYNAHEAVFLSEQGFDDILLGYPMWREGDIRAVCGELRKGKRIVLMVDAAEQIGHTSQIGLAEGVTIPLCIDVDMSSSFPGIHFGVRRSPITAPQHLEPLLNALDKAKGVSLVGLMGYEAQIAGLGEKNPANGLNNLLIPFLKRRSVKELAARRATAVGAIRARGHKLALVNGGGTGSMETTREEAEVTEITAGSGFFSSYQFDYYTAFRHNPAAAYAIEIVRIPMPGLYTCAGGGYPASGPASKDKLPLPYLPEGAKLLGQEGAGEVQTPIAYDGPEKLGLGEPVFLRHFKAGELFERFNTALLISKGKVIDEVPTYRGLEKCFL